MRAPFGEPFDDLERSVRDLLLDEANASETMDAAQKARILRGLEQALGLPPEGGPDGGASSNGGEKRASATRQFKPLLLPLAALAVAAAAALVVRGSAFRRHHATSIRRDEVTELSVGTARAAASHVVADEAPFADGSNGRTVPTLSVDDLPNAGIGVGSSTRRTPPAHVGEPTNPPTLPSLADERALVTRLRGALIARRFDDASRLLREHEEVFPDGQLVTEREAMRVWLLEDSGERQAAADGAKRFHERYPDSVMRSAVERRAIDPSRTTR